MGVARKLANSWRRPVRWALPPGPHKDIRAWLASQVAEGLDIDDATACREAGANLLRLLDDGSVEEKPSFSVRIAKDKYGRVLAVLCCGEAKKPEGKDVLHSGRLRPGEGEDADAWTLDAFVSARRVLGWVDDIDGERIAVALREALDAHVAAVVTDTDESAGDREKAADALVTLALERYRLGLSDTGEPFAVEHDGPNITLSLRGSAETLRQRLAREYRRIHRTTPSGSALTDALTVLAGEAQDCEAEDVHLRMARTEDSVVIDLGDATGRAITVNAEGRQILQRSPVLFRRTALTRAFPIPAAGGDIAELWDHLRVALADRALVLGWILHGFIPAEPHAILLLGGQQGSAKTTTAERLVSLIDPSGAPTRTAPRDTRQHAITFAGSWAVAIDNISSISDWFSDALCRAATGDGWVDRSLYTNDELAVLQFQRVILLTSIDPGALRGDLGDRLVLVDLERIAPDERLPKSKLDTAWERAFPRIFGAVLDLLCRVLASLPSVETDSLPRMADYARVLAALDGVLGTRGLDHYAAQTQRVAEDVVEGDEVATAIVGFVRAKGVWIGTAGELLKHVSPDPRPRGWPRTPRGLGSRLRRVAPALRELGIEVVPPHPKDKRRQWSLRICGDGDPPAGGSGEGDSSKPDHGPNETAQTAQPPRTSPGGSTDTDSGRAVQQGGSLNRPADRPPGNMPGDPEKADLQRLGGSGGRMPPSDDPAETPSGSIPSTGRKEAES